MYQNHRNTMHKFFISASSFFTFDYRKMRGQRSRAGPLYA